MSSQSVRCHPRSPYNGKFIDITKLWFTEKRQTVARFGDKIATAQLHYSAVLCYFFGESRKYCDIIVIIDRFADSDSDLDIVNRIRLQARYKKWGGPRPALLSPKSVQRKWKAIAATATASNSNGRTAVVDYYNCNVYRTETDHISAACGRLVLLFRRIRLNATTSKSVQRQVNK